MCRFGRGGVSLQSGIQLLRQRQAPVAQLDRALPSEGFRPSFFSHNLKPLTIIKTFDLSALSSYFEAQRSQGVKMIAMLRNWTYH
jgi:hypothetical protein